MKAKLVKENINFERGRNPKGAMKLGLPYAPQEFAGSFSFAKFVFDHLEEITGFKPTRKLAGESQTYYSNEKFWQALRGYFLECPHTINGRNVNDSFNMTHWHEINSELRTLLRLTSPDAFKSNEE